MPGTFPTFPSPLGLWRPIEVSEMRKTLSYTLNELERVFSKRPFHGSSFGSFSHSKLLYSLRFLLRTPSFPMYVTQHSTFLFHNIASVSPKQWDCKRREVRGILCWASGACRCPGRSSFRMKYKRQVSTKYVAETATTFYFCRISDHAGRKPVLLASIIGLSIWICGFGLSRTFRALLLWFVYDTRFSSPFLIPGV